jgi:hypothetical protein
LLLAAELERVSFMQRKHHSHHQRRLVLRYTLLTLISELKANVLSSVAGPPPIVHGFIDFAASLQMISGSAPGTYFFRLSNSEPSMLIASRLAFFVSSQSAGRLLTSFLAVTLSPDGTQVKQTKRPAFTSLDAFTAFLTENATSFQQVCEVSNCASTDLLIIA